jgi:hypothetical protein
VGRPIGAPVDVEVVVESRVVVVSCGFAVEPLLPHPEATTTTTTAAATTADASRRRTGVMGNLPINS